MIRKSRIREGKNRIRESKNRIRKKLVEREAGSSESHRYQIQMEEGKHCFMIL
jgi:hypothetical protein